MVDRPFSVCNVLTCIRNLPIKFKAPICAFAIERTCHYARSNQCRVCFTKSPNFTPISTAMEGKCLQSQ